MGNCLEFCFHKSGPSYNSLKDCQKNEGKRSVICVAGLASSALWCERKNCYGATRKKVSYCSIDALAINALATLDSLKCELVEGGSLRDGTPAPTVKSRAGCKVTPVEGTAGIRTLNPGEKIPVSVWDTFIDELEDKFNFHNFAYDWRRWGDMPYVEEVVEMFRTKVESSIAKDHHESKKASVIAHSMGAPVVLYCISQLGHEWQQKFLDTVILVAPAHMGAPIMIPSFAHAAFVATLDWLPMQQHIEHSLGDLCASWPCMLAEMPMLVGEHSGWHAKHVFCHMPDPADNYKLPDIGRFLEMLCKCQEGRELGPALWPGIEKISKGMQCPAVPVEIIYGAGVDTPNQFEYRTSNIGDAPLVKENAPGDGTIVADSVKRVAEGWRREGTNGHIGCLECPGACSHKELIVNPFTIAVVEKILDHKPLGLVHVEVIRAKNLKNADLFSKSDPYVRISIPGKKLSVINTDHIENNLNPVWNFTTMLYHWNLGDEIEFAVHDWDSPVTLGDCLGKATLPTNLVMDGFEGQLDLVGAPGTVTVKVWLEKRDLSGNHDCGLM